MSCAHARALSGSRSACAWQGGSLRATEAEAQMQGDRFALKGCMQGWPISSHVTSSCAECDRTLPNVSTSCVLLVLLLVAVHAFRWLAPRQTRTASQALMCS
jgi:hypothetical protein